MDQTKSTALNPIEFYERQIEINQQFLDAAKIENNPAKIKKYSQIVADLRLKLNTFRRLQNSVASDILSMPAVTPMAVDPNHLDNLFTTPSSEQEKTVDVQKAPVKAANSSDNLKVIKEHMLKKYNAEINRLNTLIGYNENTKSMEGLNPETFIILEDNIRLLESMRDTLANTTKEIADYPKIYFKFNDPAAKLNLNFLLKSFHLTMVSNKLDRLSEKESQLLNKKSGLLLSDNRKSNAIDLKKLKKIRKLEVKLAVIKRKKTKIEKVQRIITDKKINYDLKKYRKKIKDVKKKLIPVEVAKNNINHNIERKKALLERIGNLRTKTGTLDMREASTYYKQENQMNSQIKKGFNSIDRSLRSPGLNKPIVKNDDPMVEPTERISRKEIIRLQLLRFKTAVINGYQAGHQLIIDAKENSKGISK